MRRSTTRWWEKRRIVTFTFYTRDCLSINPANRYDIACTSSKFRVSVFADSASVKNFFVNYIERVMLLQVTSLFHHSSICLKSNNIYHARFRSWKDTFHLILINHERSNIAEKNLSRAFSGFFVLRIFFMW